ncbi:hypothetical protein I4U23_027870 [Adineta vaga]|nr:hypothetical protein I4U23_027870 [Adineta vaga]
MFYNDMSYLYSDECLTSASQELPLKETKICTNETIRTPVNRRTMTMNHRSKHLLLFNDEMFKRDRNRLTIRKLREKRHSLESNMFKQMFQSEDLQSDLENQLNILQVQKTSLEDAMNNNFSMEITLTSDFNFSKKS